MSFRVRPVQHALEDVERLLNRHRTTAIGQIARMVSESVTGEYILGIFLNAVHLKTELSAASNITGIAQMAKDAHQDQDYAIGTELTTLLNAVQAVIDRVKLDIPTAGASNWFQIANFDGETIVQRTFAPATTAGLRADLQTFVDAIDPTQ